MRKTRIVWAKYWVFSVGTRCALELNVKHVQFFFGRPLTTGWTAIMLLAWPTRIMIPCTFRLSVGHTKDMHAPHVPTATWPKWVRWLPPHHEIPRSHRAGVLVRSWRGQWRAAGLADVAVVCGWRTAWTQQVGMVTRVSYHTDAPTEKPRATSTTSQSGGRRSTNGVPGRQWHLHLYCLQSTLLHHTEGEVRSGRQVAICHRSSVVYSLFYTVPVLDMVV